MEEPTTDSGVPFQSASELREAHRGLLEQLDRRLESDATPAGEEAALAELEPAIRRFLEQGAATGTFLEEVRDRTACQVLLDYWVSSLSGAGRPVRAVRLARFDGQSLPDLSDQPCPYVGLEAFHGQDFFFGREADTRSLLTQIERSPLVVVTGASGSGKSSLVMGGALPALAAGEAWRVLPPFVPADALFANLARAVSQPGEPQDAELAGLAEALRSDPEELASRLGDRAAVLTIDQFEELFTLSSAEEREALVRALVRVLEASAGHRVIVTVREEFRTRIAGLRPLEPFLEQAWYSMRPMGYEQLRAAVEKPAELVNLQFQAGIVDDLVKKVLGQAAALPLLQFTLRELWEERDRNRVTWEVYERVGDPLDALQASANEFYQGLAPQTRDEVKRILLELVRVDELLEAYRQPVRMARLLEAGRASTQEVLRLLAAGDYVRLTPESGGPEAVVEVKHEALIRNWPLFVGWIDEKRIERRQRLALAESARRWDETGRPDEGLMTGWQLEEAKRYEDLSDLEEEYVQASDAAVERAQRQKEEALRLEAERAHRLAAREGSLRKRVTWFAGLAVLGAAVLGYFAWTLNQRSDHLEMERDSLAEERDTLARERADLAERNAELEQENLALLGKSAGLALSGSRGPEAAKTRIYLHISETSQLDKAQEIAAQFEKNGIEVPPIERVPVTVKVSQVRYFWPEDAAGAEEIVQLLLRYVGAEAKSRYFQQTAPRRQYEIWFANTAFPELETRRSIEKLASDDQDDRRAARERLGAQGPEAVPQLLATLSSRGKDYRIRLGVLDALSKMGGRVTIPEDSVGSITDLLGDDDATIRKTAARLLTDSADSSTREAAVEPLLANLSDLNNGNKVYNSVVVLGEIARNVPGTRELILTRLADARDRLKRDGRGWNRTIEAIDDILGPR